MSTARFRPAELESKQIGSKFLGFCNVGIIDWEDRADQYDWADVYLVATVVPEGSQYSQEFKIAGSYDRDHKNNITTCTLLKRLYWLFDVLGFDGGPDINGTMVDGEGEPIDLVTYFSQNHVTNPLEPKHEYICYIYKEAGRKDTSKVYSTVFPKLVHNTPSGLKDLEGYIAFMKSKNLIKEVSELDIAANADPTPDNGVPAPSSKGPVRF